MDFPMSLEVALWIVGVAAVPSLGFCVFVTNMLINIRQSQSEILVVLRKPEEHGFGTISTNRIIEDNTRAMNALVHYIKWLVKHETGEEPRPPIG
jgi:hypothetical protein